MAIEIKSISNRDDLLSKVIELGNKNSKTLGLFPEGAFLDHAAKKTIIAAVDNERLAGYVLFRISQRKRLVSITHLCIDSEYRKKGVAVILLNALKEKYKNVFRGISLMCRADYESASRTWERNGFKAVNDKKEQK
jgi:ribosomal protein S18 acetylase RimI-like enzyme